MDFSEYRPDFQRDGYVVVPRFLSSDDFRLLQSELERYITQVVPNLPDSAAFYDDRSRPETLKQMQHMDADPFFREYAQHPRWLELAKSLLGEEVVCHAPEWFNKPPGTEHRTPPHQDNYYFCLKPPSVLTIWLALDPVDAENGCLRYLTGSHLRGIRPHSASDVLGFSQGITDYGPGDIASEVEIHLDPGDAVVHHGEMVHRAEANRTADRHRRAFAMVIQGKSAVRDAESFARYTDSLKAQLERRGLNA